MRSYPCVHTSTRTRLVSRSTCHLASQAHRVYLFAMNCETGGLAGPLQDRPSPQLGKFRCQLSDRRTHARAPPTVLSFFCSRVHSPRRAQATRFSARAARSIALLLYCSLLHLRPQPPPPGVSIRKISPGERETENFPGSFLRRPLTITKLLPIFPGAPLASP